LYWSGGGKRGSVMGNCLGTIDALCARPARSVWKYETEESYRRRMFIVASTVFERRMYFVKEGIATMARMPMIATTIMISMSVNPRDSDCVGPSLASTVVLPRQVDLRETAIRVPLRGSSDTQNTTLNLK
jgi:hypothetical protein